MSVRVSVLASAWLSLSKQFEDSNLSAVDLWSLLQVHVKKLPVLLCFGILTDKTSLYFYEDWTLVPIFYFKREDTVSQRTQSPLSPELKTEQ